MKIMTKIITFIALFIASIVLGQTNYEKGMQDALSLWKNNAFKQTLSNRLLPVDAICFL